MKFKKQFISLFLIFILVLSFSFPVSAASSSTLNKQAHKAYVKQLKKAKKNFCSSFKTTLEYAYRDVDGDNIDELIIYPGYGYCSQVIYDYQNKKVKQTAIVSQGTFTRYYPKKKVLYIKDAGHMGYLTTSYYVQKNGTYKLAAYVSKYYSGSYDKAPDETHYYIGISTKKEVSKSVWKRYVKNLTKGSSSKSFSSIKWKEY